MSMTHLVKSDDEILLLREGGKRLARILKTVAKSVKPGVRTDELDALAEKLITEGGDIPAFKNYTPDGSNRPFPATLCVSINSEVVHGIPNEHPRTLKEGDIVGLDLGLSHKGLIVDSAVTVPVGVVSKEIKDLVSVTKEALTKGIAAAQGGAKTGDIGHAIESFVNGRYGIVEELGGHGVGHAVHEEPMIPNYGSPYTGMELTPGMVVALEPMLNLGSKDVYLDKDGYTFKTRDGKASAHFEHTILITKGKPEILTK